MFKKRCLKCKNKISKSFDFCPYCGSSLISKSDNSAEYGMLGKNDILDENIFQQANGTPFMEKVLNQTMKMFEKQMRSLSEEMKQEDLKEKTQNRTIPISHNIQFFVNGKRVFPQGEPVVKEIPKKVKPVFIPKEKMNKFISFPKHEPVSKMKRLGAKIVYELEVPGVNDISDVLITRLENSIEIKALSENKVYSKILNVNLPIIRYGLANGNLILELQGR